MLHDRLPVRKVLAGLGVALLVTLGIFASNDWFPKTDPLTGKKTGWFGLELPKNSTASGWNPIPPPSPTPQLSKEYIYAGSRLLAVEDANAVAAPPADIAVWRPSNGYWYIMGQTGSAQSFEAWGQNADKPVPGDYDADGKTDLAVWRESTGVWYIYFTSTASWVGWYWGASGDIPVPADYDGDGKTDIAVARPDVGDNSLIWLVSLSGGGYINQEWGEDDDLPGPADFDGDGKADLGVFREANEHFYWLRSSDDLGSGVDMNVTGDTVVSSDYDGDGKADPALFNSSTGYWYIVQSTTNTLFYLQWGSAGDVPVHNDYDLDGKTDIAVCDNTVSVGPPAAPAVWTIRRSSNGTTRTEYWGQNADIPVPAFYRR